MPTNLKDFETELDYLSAANGITTVMETCKNNYLKKNNNSYTGLDDSICLRKRNGIFYNVYENSQVNRDFSGAGLVYPYTYGKLETKVFSLANSASSGFVKNSTDYATDLNNINYNMENTTSKFYAHDFNTRNLYNSMVPIRNKLDRKMRTLYGKDNDAELQYNHGVLVNLTWTVLATCTLYFLFVRL